MTENDVRVALNNIEPKIDFLHYALGMMSDVRVCRTSDGHYLMKPPRSLGFFLAVIKEGIKIDPFCPEIWNSD